MHAKYEHSPPTSSRSDHRDAQAAGGQRSRTVLAGRTASDHDHVELAR